MKHVADLGKSKVTTSKAEIFFLEEGEGKRPMPAETKGTPLLLRRSEVETLCSKISEEIAKNGKGGYPTYAVDRDHCGHWSRRRLCDLVWTHPLNDTKRSRANYDSIRPTLSIPQSPHDTMNDVTRHFKDWEGITNQGCHSSSAPRVG